MTVREQLFTLLRNLRWIIVLSVLLSVLLYLPDQIRELYRIAADDAGWVLAVKSGPNLRYDYGAFLLGRYPAERRGLADSPFQRSFRCHVLSSSASDCTDPIEKSVTFREPAGLRRVAVAKVFKLVSILK